MDQSTDQWIESAKEMLGNFLFLLKGQRTRVLYSEKQLHSLVTRLVRWPPPRTGMTLIDALKEANKTAQPFRRKSWNPALQCKLVDAGDDFVVMYKTDTQELSKFAFRFQDVTADDYEMVVPNEPA